MAEENPLIEIKVPPKKIEDTREQYLFENEKLIIGPSGFDFRAYPTLKERLQQYNKEQELYNEHIKLHKSNSTNNLHSKKKDLILHLEKHKKKTDSLVNKYQSRIRKFIIDVSICFYLIYLNILDGRRKPFN